MSDENEGSEGETSEQAASNDDDEVTIDSEQYWTEEGLDVSLSELYDLGFELPPDAMNDPDPNYPVA